MKLRVDRVWLVVLCLHLLPATVRSASSGIWAQRLTKVSLFVAPESTIIGMSSRAITIDAINQMKRGEKEAAMESLQQAITTLAVLDVAGGAVVQNPWTSLIANDISTKRQFQNVNKAIANYRDAISRGVSSAITDQDELIHEVKALKKTAIDEFKSVVSSLPESDDTLKCLKKAAKWTKVGKALDVFGVFFDAIAIGVNAWAFDSARKAGNDAGMASSGLSMAAGIVGVSTFLYSVVTGSTIAGPLGAVVGALLGLVATLIDVFSSHPSSNIDATIKNLRTLTQASKDELDDTRNFLLPLGKKFGTIYESNAANMIEVLGMPPAPLSFKPFSGGATSGGHLGAGKFRMVDLSQFSNAYWTVSGTEPIGYDFYGKRGDENSHGVTVFVDTKLVKASGRPLKGAMIQTYSDGSENYYIHDHVTIEDFGNLKSGQTIKVKTGYGNDVIAINGPVGKFTSAFSNVLDVTTGTAENELTFGGIPNAHAQIKGVYFNRINERVGFFHGSNRQRHEFGTIRGIVLVRGSPFNDHIVLHGNDFRVEQSHGQNVYEIDLIHASTDSGGITQTIVDDSGKVPRIRVTSSGDIGEENFNYNHPWKPAWDKHEHKHKLLFRHPETVFPDVLLRYYACVSHKWDLDSGIVWELAISVRNEDGSWFLLRTLKLSYKVEPLVELYVNGSITKHLYVGWMKKVQVTGEQYNYQFHSDLTGTNRNDLVNIIRPGSGPQSSHTVDLKEGDDVLVLTENLMEVYSIKSGHNTLHLVFNGVDYVLQIRSVDSSYIRHDVILRDVEFIMNEDRAVLVNMKAEKSNNFDLGKIYKRAQALSRK